MSHINTDQKLQLVQTIRMQNHYNRMKCQEREQLLYGVPVRNGKRELYGAESTMSFPLTGEVRADGKKSSILTGFRLRFLFALIILSAFIYLDKNEITILGKNTYDLFAFLTETIDFPIDLGFLKSFDL